MKRTILLFMVIMLSSIALAENYITAHYICDENNANCKDISTGWAGGGSSESIWTNSSGNATFTSGNVGIGTSTPTQLLHIKTSSSTRNAQVLLENDLGAKGRIWVGRSGNAEQSGNLILSPNTSKNIFIDNSAIGTTVIGAQTVSNSDNVFEVDGNVSLARSSGLVGIGTTNPTAKLHVSGESEKITVSDESADLNVTIQADNTGGVFGTFTDHPIRFFTNGSEAMRITNTSEIGIGTATPAHPVDISANFQGYAARIFNDGNFNNRNGLLIQTGEDIFTENNYYVRFNDGDGDQVGMIKANVGVFEILGRAGHSLGLGATSLTGDDLFIDNDTGNVGLGLTTPSHKLHVYDPSSGDNMLAVTGTSSDASTPLGIDFDNAMHGANLQLTFNAENDGGVDQSGTLDWDPDLDSWYFQNGNIGIGTSSPSYLVDIAGSTDPRIRITDSDDNVEAYMQAHSSGVFMGTLSTHNLSIGTEGNSELVITTGSNVGIGTISPGRKFVVYDSSGGGVGMQVSNSDAGSDANSGLFMGLNSAEEAQIINYETGKSLSFWTDGVEQMTLASSGNLGIGITDPSYGNLQVVDDINVTYNQTHGVNIGGTSIIIQNNNLTTDSTADLKFFHGTSGSSVSRIASIRQSTGSELAFITQRGSGRAETMRIDNTGKVGIGTKDPSATLDVAGTINATGDICTVGGPCLSTVSSSGGGWTDDGTAVRLTTSSDLVGIGTSNPSAPLTVTTSSNDAINITSPGGDNGFMLKVNEAGGALMEMYDGAGSQRTTISARPGGDTYFANKGKVGINTSSPTAALDIVSEGADSKVLRLGTERAWTFEQENSGASAALRLRAEVDGASKHFSVDTDGYFMKRNRNATETDFIVDDTGNVGVGTTNPIDKFHVVRESTYNSSIRTGSTNGFVNFQITNGTNTIHLFRTNNAGNSYLAANGGNVGIGTTSPTDLLHVSAGISGALPGGHTDFIVEDDVDAQISILSGATKKGKIAFGDSGASTAGFIYYDQANNELEFGTNTNEVVTFDSSGNVGVGTTSPGSALDVHGGEGVSVINAQSDDGYRIALRPNMSGTGNIVAAKSGSVPTNISFSTQTTSGTTTERMRITDKGHVGIGTTTPDAALTLIGSTGESSSLFKILDDDGTVNIQMGDSGSAESSYITLYEDGVARTHITTDPSQTGSDTYFMDTDVGIRTQHPSAPLEVNSTGVSNNFVIKATRATTGNPIGGFYQASGGAGVVYGVDSSGFYKLRLHSEGTSYFGGGNVGVGDSDPSEATLSVQGGTICDADGSLGTCSSDLRLKENILPIDDALGYLDDFRPVRFNFIGEDETMTGLIAQEIQAVHPELVFETGEYDYITYTDPGFKYILIKAVQELKAENEALKELVCLDHPEADICN